MQQTLLILSLAMAADAWKVTADGLKCRSEPHLNAGIVRQYNNGDNVAVSCTSEGDYVFGNTVWDNTQDNCWVSAYYVDSGGKRVAGACGSGYPVTTDGLKCRSAPNLNAGIARQYNTGDMLQISCVADGDYVFGNTKWDKTQDGCFVSDYYVETMGKVVAGACGGNTPPPSGGNLPGLNAVQSAHARAIIAEAKAKGVGRQGCLAGIATAIVESNILIYANNGVPASLNYPHDAIGSDSDSVGIFQQRAVYYPNISCDMDAACSAGQFFDRMVTFAGWQTMDVGTLCQKVQVSAYPARYGQHVGEATSICSAGGL